jgi:hypothetical protein
MASTEPPDDLHDAALAEDIALLGDMMAATSARSRRRRRRLRSRGVRRARKR